GAEATQASDVFHATTFGPAKCSSHLAVISLSNDDLSICGDGVSPAARTAQCAEVNDSPGRRPSERLIAYCLAIVYRPDDHGNGPNHHGTTRRNSRGARLSSAQATQNLYATFDLRHLRQADQGRSQKWYGQSNS
ncbi:hypothetical protein RZS08_32000, partial [Arthrospira platensis SPKY1]|nr:hypothetical protein [Arthrospira platensis SPKY1]